MDRTCAVLIWVVIAAAIAVPLVAAATSPLLQWRQPIYIVAGFCGALAMALLLVQPMLAAGLLPGITERRARRIHRWTGAGLVFAILVHVGGLWITSPPDVIDALTFTSPTPFSAWGVIAMWALFATASLAALRRKLRIRLRMWAIGHGTLAAIIVTGSVVHALLIEGTMETFSKTALSLLVLLATAIALLTLYRRMKKRAPPGSTKC